MTKYACAICGKVVARVGGRLLPHQTPALVDDITGRPTATKPCPGSAGRGVRLQQTPDLPPGDYIEGSEVR